MWSLRVLLKVLIMNFFNEVIIEVKKTGENLASYGVLSFKIIYTCKWLQMIQRIISYLLPVFKPNCCLHCCMDLQFQEKIMSVLSSLLLIFQTAPSFWHLNAQLFCSDICCNLLSAVLWTLALFNIYMYIYALSNYVHK